MVSPSLICDFCPSDQGFAYSFFQIQTHSGHHCCSAIHCLIAQACPELLPIKTHPWRANQRNGDHTVAEINLLIISSSNNEENLIHSTKAERNNVILAKQIFSTNMAY